MCSARPPPPRRASSSRAAPNGWPTTPSGCSPRFTRCDGAIMLTGGLHGLPDPDPRLFPLINEFARDTPWLPPVVIGYPEYAIVVFAAPLLRRWGIGWRGAAL